jgi:F-type H+-transporting ATPase subunit b
MDINLFDPKIVYTVTTILYIITLFVFFWRRQKKQEKELEEFLNEAKDSLALHKQEANVKASKKVYKAFDLIKRLQTIAENLEQQAKAEYEQIIEDAQAEKREIMDSARKQASEITSSAEGDLDEYKQKRQQEIEKHLVKLVMSVTEKVVQRSLDYDTHIDLINEAIEEVEEHKERLK